MSFYNKETWQQYLILGLLFAVGLLFLAIIQPYIMALVLSGIIAGLLYPSYRWVKTKTKGRESISAVFVIGVFLLCIVIPFIFFVGMVMAEAIMVTEDIRPFIEEQIDANGGDLGSSLPEWIPFREELRPYHTQITTKAGELATEIGRFLVQGLSSITQGSFAFFLNLFILVYALYFFLIYGKDIQDKVHSYLPLSKEQVGVLFQKIISVSRATLKGAILIGVLQGSLVGLAFWVLGIRGALFWGTISAILSVIPSVGSGLVWVPAAIYLLATGQEWQAAGLVVWGAAIVGSVDNILRPALVGNDTQLPDLIILTSTLGGIGYFGVTGFVIGPIIAGLLVSIAQMYREVVISNEKIIENEATTPKEEQTQDEEEKEPKA